MKAILISLLSASIFGILLLSIQAIFQGGPLISNLLIFLLCIFVGSIAFAIPIAREWITLRKTIGLRDVYRNIAVCEKTIKKRLESANNVEIFMKTAPAGNADGAACRRTQ